VKPDPLAPESQRFARFRVIRDLGRGAQGAIFEAIDVERDVRVAIKTLRAVEPDTIARIKSEFRVVRDLRHPNLVRIGELVEEGGRWFFTMELVDGVNLLSYVRGDVARPPAAYDDRRLRRSLVQLASVLDYFHASGKVHRDLKPSNILVDSSGRAVLIDFGVAGEHSDEDDLELVGTVPYMAPEQVLGAAVGPAADWYAFGVILFEAITGRRPFEGDAQTMMERKLTMDAPRPSDFVREVPHDLEALCLRLLARDPRDRATSAEVARTLGVSNAGRGSPEPLFVGRKRELEALSLAFEDVARGRAVTLVLEGESGVGKSALARRFVEDLRAREPPPLILAGRCHENESVPYNAFDAVIEALARHLMTRLPTARRDLLPGGIDCLAALFPTLGRVDGEARVMPAAVDARVVRDDAFDALRELLGNVARRWPTVVLLEDLQWADADSLGLLEALTDAPGAPELLVLATARRSVEGAPCAAVDSMGGEVRRVAVEGLAATEADTLVRRLLDRLGTRSSVEPDAIVESAGGHPMFIEELVHFLSRPRSKARAAALDDALRARVSELGAGAQRVLSVVCVAGVATEQGVIANAAGVSFAIYSRAAAALHEAKLARIRGPRSDDQVEPFHDRVREAVHAALTESQLASTHGELARALEASRAGPELLFHHFAAAGQRDRALEFAELAAEAATRSLAFDRAADVYRRALAMGAHDEPHRRRLLTGLGERLVDAGRSKEAARYFFEAASTGAPERLVRLDLLRRAAERFLMSGHVDEGLATTRDVLAASGLSMPRTWLGGVAQLGWHQLRLSRKPLTWKTRRMEDVDAASAMRMDLCWSVGAGLALVDSLRSALFFARGALECVEHGDDARIARALAGAAVAEAGLLRRAGAARVGAACRRAADADASERSRSYAALVGTAEAFFLANDWRATVMASREARRLWQATGRNEGWEVDIADQFECWALDNAGSFRDLAERVPARIRAAQRSGNRFVEVSYRTQFVHLRLLPDRPNEARREVEDAIAIWPRADDSFGNQDYLALRGLTAIALYERDERAATDLLPRWRRYFASLLGRVPFLRLDALWNVGSVALLRAGGALARGEATQARAHLREARRARADVMRIESPYARANGGLLRIGIALLEGDLDAAVLALREGIRDADARGADLHGAVMRARLGAILDGDEGSSLKRSAQEWMRAQNVRDPPRLAGTVLVDVGR
jgi:eukaryotic-like serine/threonine-protein kinase